jgi:hypothetical protein
VHIPSGFALVFTCCLSVSFAQRLQHSTEWAALAACSPQTDIRVSLINGINVRGALQGVSPDALEVKTADGQQRLAREEIKRVQMRRGGRRGRHMLIGMAVGAGTGLAVGAIGDHVIHDRPCTGTGWCVGPDLSNVGKMVLTPVGAVVGALVGMALPSQGWTDLYQSRKRS